MAAAADRSALARAANGLARGAILAYRYGVSPVIGPRCRFFPSCSEYGLEALERFGVVRGAALTAARLARCHPWHPGGVDPVPEPDAGGDAASPGRYLGRALRRAPAGPSPAEPRASSLRSK